MKIQDLMEKLSKMDKNQELIVEGLEDEVETTETEEVVEEPKDLWDIEVPDEAYADEQSKGYHQVIKTAHDHKLGKSGKIKTPGGDKDSPDAGIYYDENHNNETDRKKLKLIAKWKWIEAGMPANFGGHIDDEIELPKYEEYKAKYDAWKAENPGIAQYFSKDDEELDECGSACGKVNECGSACSKPVTEEAEEPIVEEEEPVEESAEVIEERLNEQMKSDYQKELESISDFLF